MAAIHNSIDNKLAEVLVQKLAITHFVETATSSGDAVASIRYLFAEFDTCEVSTEKWAVLKGRFLGDAAVRCHLGSGSAILKDLVPALAGKAVLYFLNVNSSSKGESNNPLIEELESIKVFHRNSVIWLWNARQCLSDLKSPEGSALRDTFKKLFVLAQKPRLCVIVGDSVLFFPRKIAADLFEYLKQRGIEWEVVDFGNASTEGTLTTGESNDDQKSGDEGKSDWDFLRGEFDLEMLEDACKKALQKSRTSLGDAMEKHFCKKGLKFGDNEPRYNFLKRFFLGFFRSQTSVDKNVIRTLRFQLSWSEKAERRLDELERMISELEFDESARRVHSSLLELEAGVQSLSKALGVKMQAKSKASPFVLPRQAYAVAKGAPTVENASKYAGFCTRMPQERDFEISLPVETAWDKYQERFTHFVARFMGRKSHSLERLVQYHPEQGDLEDFPAPTFADEEMPSIAIVTPSYMQGHFIEDTILSVVEQNYPKLRYVVQDGGSSDDTVEVLKKHEAKLESWCSEKDGGQSAAIYTGFQKVQGEVMAYLNSDDTLMPGVLRFVGEYFTKNPDVDVVYGHRVIIDETNLEVGRMVLPPHNPDLVRWVDYVPQETMFWRASIWEKVGGVDPKFRFAMDWDLILRFQRAGARIVRLPYFMGRFRVHSEQKTIAEIGSVGAEEVAYLRWRENGYAMHKRQVKKVRDLERSRSAITRWLLDRGIRV